MTHPTDLATDLAGKTALVTGGSRGIGAGIVTALHTRGARCIINYVADDAGRNLAEAQAVSAQAGGAPLIECDVSKFDDVARMMAQVQADFGGLDILVNNAGILRDRSLRKLTEADWNAVIAVNLTGTFHCIKHASPILRAGGRVVNLSSVSGWLGFFGQANYAASKAGVMALTKTCARELARQRVTVNAVAPGFIDTDMTRSMPKDVRKSFLEQIPAGRYGTIDDVGNAVMFLVSPASDYITGQVLHVNGGFHMP